jgi:hypothetical protein
MGIGKEQLKKEKVQDDMRRDMMKEPDINWCLEQVEKELAKTHSPASNIMNIISHIQSKVNELNKEIIFLQPCNTCGHPKKMHKYEGYVKERCVCEGVYNNKEPCDCECFIKYQEEQ